MKGARWERLGARFLLVLGVAGVLGAGPQVGKPAPGPGAAQQPAVAGERAPDPAEAANRRAAQAQEARDRADRLRAKYEAAHRPGPVAEGSTKEFDQVVSAYRDAIDVDPRGEVATYCRQCLAGAYTYTQDFEAALRVHVEAVNVAAGALEQVKACHGAGYHCLQAMHDPVAALKWFKRAQAHLEKIEDPQERAKYATACAEGIARCEQEIRR
jgi:tetratricopeptide (TPR) repeat protein